MKKISDLTLSQKILEGISFAVIEWRSAFARPMVGWLAPVSLASCGVLMTGFMISSIGFALRQKK